MIGAQAFTKGAWHRYKEDVSRDTRNDLAKKLEKWGLRSPEAVGTSWRSTRIETRDSCKNVIRNGLRAGIQSEINRMNRRDFALGAQPVTEDMVYQSLRRNIAAKATLLSIMSEPELRELIAEVLEARENEDAEAENLDDDDTPSLELTDSNLALKAELERATTGLLIADDYILEHNSADHLLDFSYDPLPLVKDKSPVRLITLEPGDRDEVLTCTIVDTALEDSPPFESLSYCWGATDNLHKISLNGRNFEIRYNLALALLYLRDHKSPRRLWIDALCINQSDDEERSLQVGMMSRIYGRAEQTVVWLGMYHRDGAAGFNMLRRLAAEAESKEAHSRSLEQVDYHMLTGNYSYETMRQTGWLKRSTSEGLEPESFEDPEIDGVQGLLCQDWFTRIWVIQEISLCTNATFVWFDETLDWKIMRRGLAEGLINDVFQQTFVGLLRHDVFDKYRSIASIDQLEEEPNAASRLLHLLARFHDWDASDKRDKVYGLLGLVGDGGSDLGMLPDYSLTVAETFTKTARIILERTKDLKILDLCSIKASDTLEDLPSWVPDWSNTAETALPFDEGVTGPFGSSTATGQSSAFLCFENNLLGLRGHVVDKVVEVGDKLPSCARSSFDDYHDPEGKYPVLDEYFDDPDVDDAIALIKSKGFSRWERTRLYWKLIPRTGLVVHAKLKPIAEYLKTLSLWYDLARCGEEKEGYVAGGTNAEAFMYTLVAGCMPDGLSQTTAEFNHWLQSLPPIRRMLKLHMDRHDHAFVTMAFFSYMRHTWEGYDPFNALLEHARIRCMARTEKGYLALVPPNTQAGDSIGLFEGGRWPIVFRRNEGANENSILGDSYVHGIMDGRSFDQKRCETMWFK